MSGSGFYYGVKRGKQTGIFRTWKECEQQISGFSGALFKKFPSAKEAQEYVAGETKTKSDVSQTTKPVIYFDGGCRKEVGGAACYLVDDNIVYLQKLAAPSTNNQAELHGLWLALNQALKRNWKDVEIRGDSLYAMNTSSGEWKMKNKNNHELVQRNRDLVAQFSRIDWRHVRGHSKEPGNDVVDQYATHAISYVDDYKLYSLPISRTIE